MGSSPQNDSSDAVATESRQRLLRAVLGDEGPLSGALDMMTQTVVASLRVPVALVSLVDRDRQHFLSQVGVGGEHAAGTPISHSFCQHVTATGKPLIIASSVEHPLVSANPAIEDLGVAAYAGEPITVHGRVIGSMCLIDHVPHAWTEPELTALRAFADLAEFLIAARLQTQGVLADERAISQARDDRQSAEIAGYVDRVEEQDRVAALSRRLQSALLPEPIVAGDLQVDVFYEPGQSRLLLGAISPTPC